MYGKKDFDITYKKFNLEWITSVTEVKNEKNLNEQNTEFEISKGLEICELG